MGTKTSVPLLKVPDPMHNNISAHNLGIITSLPIKVLLHPRTVHCTITSSAKKKKRNYNAQ